MKLQDEFEEFMDAKARELKGEWFDAKVVGVTMPNDTGSSRQKIAAGLRAHDELEIVPEPGNPYDANAMKLITPNDEQVGYLEARLAAELVRRGKRGGGARCYVRAIRQRGLNCGVSIGLLQFGAK